MGAYHQLWQPGRQTAYLDVEDCTWLCVCSKALHRSNEGAESSINALTDQASQCKMSCSGSVVIRHNTWCLQAAGMALIKIMTVVGARPQFVKAAVVSRAIAECNKLAPAQSIIEQIVHTGQHYDYMMSQAFFDEMALPRPVINLGVGSGLHGAMLGAMVTSLEQEILTRRPDWVLVYGDTNSTLAGALAAAKLHVPVAHVEAGLRSFNRRMPEEINRVLTDHVSDHLFCPSEGAKAQLAREGITQGVHVVGDVMYDAVCFYRQKAIAPTYEGPYVIASLHRAENTDDPQRLQGILRAMGQAPLPVMLPLHPRTRLIFEREHLTVYGQTHILEPQSYFAMLGHLERCAFVITDSGGLQKEAFFFGKKCITVRDETEWTELVACGANRVVGTEEAAICAVFPWALQPLSQVPELYGQGNAGERIVQLLVQSVDGARAEER
jgi:UDP-GlcNAc3NAcA epimerase